MQASQAKPRTRRRADTQLVFGPAQKAPDQVLDAILEQWLVPALVEQFLCDLCITPQSLSAHYSA